MLLKISNIFLHNQIYQPLQKKTLLGSVFKTTKMHLFDVYTYISEEIITVMNHVPADAGLKGNFILVFVFLISKW